MKKTHLLFSLIAILVIHHLPLHQSYAQRYNFKTFNVEDGLAMSQVYSMCQDKEGNLWFGTFGGGVCKYNGVEFKTFTTKDGLEDNDIYCLYTDSHGDIWIGTYDGLSKYQTPKPISTSSGMNQFNQGRFINYNRRQGMKCRRITSIYEDHKGNIWVGGYGGLSKIELLKIKESENSTYDNNNEKMFFNHYGMKEGLSDSIVTAITEDNYGKLYIAIYYGLNVLSFLPLHINDLDSSSVLINKITLKMA